MVELCDKSMLKPVNQHFRHYNNEGGREYALKNCHGWHDRNKRCWQKGEGRAVKLDKIAKSDDGQHERKLKTLNDVCQRYPYSTTTQ